MDSLIANTTVVLLAAGHGKRMLPLTKSTPKPLLTVGQHSLIEHHLKRISAQGFKHVVINIAHLAEQFPTALGDGQQYGLRIDYSDESQTGALETAGGLKNALTLIKSDPFITINADIWTDYDFSNLIKQPPQLAKLVMVDNPEHNPEGDFGLSDTGLLNNTANEKLTFSGIAIYHKTVFEKLEHGKQALAPIFHRLIDENALQGTKLMGEWQDIGTPERLEELRLKHARPN